MDFAFDELSLELAKGARVFGEREVFPSVLERDKNAQWDPVLFRKMGAAGLLGAPFPEEYGGSGLSAVTTCLVKENFAYGASDAGLALAWGAHTILCGVPIWKLGTKAQKERYLPKMCTGEWVGAFCLSEPGSGSDAASMKTTAVKKGDRYFLNGTKMWITNGPVANHFVVTAVTTPGAKAFGITTFLVEKDFPGFSIGQKIDKTGMRTSTTCEIILQDCEVPEENVLGEVNAGFVTTARLILGWERSCLLAPGLGSQRRNLDACVAYAKEREQFGRPIAKFQAIGHMLAQMRLRYEVARLPIYRVAWQLDHGDEPPLVDAAIAKLIVSEGSQQSARDAVQIHGGNGFTPEFHVERSVRDSLLGTIGAGTSEIQRGLIARALLHF